MEKHVPILAGKYGISAAPMTPQMFGAAGKEHMEKYGETPNWLSYCPMVGPIKEYCGPPLIGSL